MSAPRSDAGPATAADARGAAAPIPRIRADAVVRGTDRLSRFLFGALIVAIVVYVLAPILIVLVASVSKTPYLTFPPVGFTLRWFTSVENLRDYFAAFLFSLKVALLATALSLVLGSWIGIALSRADFPGKTLLNTLFMSPLIIPELALALGLLQFFSQMGGIKGLWPTLFAHGAVCTPYVIRSVLATAMGQDDSLQDAAQSLGARPWRILRDITLPLLRPALVSGGIMAFIISFDNVTISFFLSAPGATTLPALLFNEASETGLNSVLAAVCAMVTVFMLLLMVIVQKCVGMDRFASREVPTAPGATDASPPHRA